MARRRISPDGASPAPRKFSQPALTKPNWAQSAQFRQAPPSSVICLCL